RHKSHHTVEKVVDVAEGPRLAAIAIDRDRLAQQCLYDEIRHDATVLAMHARAVGVEYAHDLDRHALLAVIVEEQRLGCALSLVVAGTRSYRIAVPPILLDLRMNGRGAGNLAGGCL